MASTRVTLKALDASKLARVISSLAKDRDARVAGACKSLLVKWQSLATTVKFRASQTIRQHSA